MRAPKPVLAVFALALLLAGGCANHAQTSRDMLTLTPESMQMRQLQTKRYDTGDEKMVLQASASVLQDLGFQLDESTPDLGIIVGSKKRDATDAGQVALAIFVAALSRQPASIDDHQTIRVSLATAPMAKAREGGEKNSLTPEAIAAASARLSARLKTHYDEELKRLLPKAEVSNAGTHLCSQAVKTFSDDLTARMRQKDFGATRVRVTFQRVVVNTQGRVTLAEALTEPDMYQEFFEKLSKSVFLEANDI